VTDARIIDRRYSHYDGPRLGPRHAMRSVYIQTLRRVLGLHRPARWKVLPILSAVMAYLPAVAFIGIVALLPRRVHALVPRPEAYYGFVSAAIALFVLFVAPEALCPDRRSRVLSLYLASPLTRTTYLVAKILAVATVLLLVTLGPPLLFLVGLVLESAGPHGVTGFGREVWRIGASGVVLAGVYAAASAAFASLTDRRAVASGASLLVLIGSGAVTAILHFALGAPEWVLLFGFNPLSGVSAPFELVQRIHGLPGFVPGLDTAALVAACAAATWAGLLVCWARYRSIQVTR